MPAYSEEALKSYGEQAMEYRVFEYQRAGFTMREIAERLGVDVLEVNRIVVEWLNRKWGDEWTKP